MTPFKSCRDTMSIKYNLNLTTVCHFGWSMTVFVYFGICMGLYDFEIHIFNWGTHTQLLQKLKTFTNAQEGDTMH